MTALSGTIGTGNIAGVATAIVSGGPGALFWIWAYGFVATTIKFTEAVLGVTWREASGTTMRSGPMYALRDGLKQPWLASTYALVAGVAAITTTPFTQPNSIAIVLESRLGVPTWLAGIVIAVLVWLVIVGGIGSIGRAAEKLAPLKVGAVPRRRSHRHHRVCRQHPVGAGAGVQGGLLAAGDGRRRARHGRRDAVWPGARHVRQRGGLRHGVGRLWHRAQSSSGAAGAASRDGSGHRLVRHVDDQRA